VIGTVELLGLAANGLTLHGRFWYWVAGIDINTLGYIIAGLFALTWALATAIWRLGRIEERWSMGDAPD
jgi:high-affinity nickel-transport protein